ncbi:hypothetical protein BpHYR1_044890, partial [Brachionus plicatilis]
KKKIKVCYHRLNFNLFHLTVHLIHSVINIVVGYKFIIEENVVTQTVLIDMEKFLIFKFSKNKQIFIILIKKKRRVFRRIDYFNNHVGNN